MQRVPEPELMNDLEQACAYAGADFDSPHNQFIDLVKSRFPNLIPDFPVLDLGCGPADVSRRFARSFPECTIHAVDGAANMLRLAHQANVRDRLDQRITLIEACLPCDSLTDKRYSMIISNSLLHHLHNPAVLWQTIKNNAAEHAVVFVMDLLRPATRDVARQLVDLYAGAEPDILRRDFMASLCAAFTAGEIQQQLLAEGLDSLTVEVVSDRHVIIYGTIV